MNASTKASIRESLFNHHEFQDCVLEDVKWRHFGSCLELVFNYIWNDSNGFYLDSTGKPAIKESSIRTDLSAPQSKAIVFNLVQEFRIQNYLNEVQENNPGQIDWGFSEVARVSIEDDNLFLAKYRNHPVAFHHVSCRWENDRRIDIVFSSLEIQQRAS